MRIGSLCTGIGGIDLAARKFGDIVFQVEKEPFCNRVLQRHFPDVPRFLDARMSGLDLPQCDLLMAGFPCQDLSIVGRREGISGSKSGLFFDVWRIAQEQDVRYLFLENVPGIYTSGLDVIVRTITEAGWTIEWTELSARDVGAPHWRRRWWAICHREPDVLLRQGKEIGGWGRDSYLRRTNQTSLFSHIESESLSRMPFCGYAKGDNVYETKPLYPKLPQKMLWPTPTTDFRNVKYKQGGTNLHLAVKTWPTPRSGKPNGDSVERFLRARAEKKVSTPPLETAVWIEESTEDGNVNPDWVDLLMGYPAGYTEPEGEPMTTPLENWMGWESDISRLKVKPKNWRKRLEALGNSVVPQCVTAVLKEIFDV
tara:strand:- start:7068 stop:8174 length:1107 start_codon:yes stop_codon:yes gene_type:complete